MSEQTVYQYAKFDLLKKFLFTSKVNKQLKYCKNIESYLLSNDYLKKLDSRLNLIISDGFSSEVKNSYFLYKGYTQDGSLTPLQKYTVIDGEVKKHIDVITHGIIIIDLYEESIYLHSYLKNSNYITGYLIKEETTSETNKTLIFSNEKIKINIKNINTSDTILVVDDFINKFII
ncbi:hypothetical protein KTC92_14925 [Clostridium sp. CM027]|uniref:hypothetical protein n=1 Tax=Clostridium sp. CM027 TaxID=2849865 RepID=UPI001C6E2197|nr:hypothetical protein [Clostridium sp. CM027]MBW9145274.1 hypothetical protein [Clostridium sp. CM027]UVE40403.1 hypothetical protein KTC92_14925 [Clostridium sp. CM027]